MACGSLSLLSDAQYYLCECSEHYPILAAKLDGVYTAEFRATSGLAITQHGARRGRVALFGWKAMVVGLLERLGDRFAQHCAVPELLLELG